MSHQTHLMIFTADENGPAFGGKNLRGLMDSIENLINDELGDEGQTGGMCLLTFMIAYQAAQRDHLHRLANADATDSRELISTVFGQVYANTTMDLLAQLGRREHRGEPPQK